MQKQLDANQYYLSFLHKKLYSFTYVVSEKQLYLLDDNKNFIKTDFPFLILKLEEQNILNCSNIDDLFNPSNYLISPFNSTDSFINNKYFLTDQQINIKKDISSIIEQHTYTYITIDGAPGTGKTLLSYDIAKKYINNNYNVLIIHCGKLNAGHYLLRDKYNWNICSIKDSNKYDLSKYDLIIIDETQRITTYQLDNFISQTNSRNSTCIFAFDPKQCLTKKEILRNIPEYIKSNISTKDFTLTEKVRSNKEIASFIKNLFDLSKKSPDMNYSHIDLHYFQDTAEAKKYIETLHSEGWMPINYTPSIYDDDPYEEHNSFFAPNAHDVIGQEFDNVIAVIDKYFYYRPDNLLSTRGYNSHYHPTRMLFEILTRTRNKLCLIIIDNEILLKECLNILHV